MKPNAPGSANSLKDNAFPILLRSAWYALNQSFRRRIAHLGLTPDQYTVLRNLSEQPGLTQRELCARMTSDPNTIAALTARMAGEGWIQRNPCATDRRANRLTLLPAGQRKLAAALPIATALKQEVTETLAPQELEVLTASLSKLAKSCRSALRHSPKPSKPPTTSPPSKSAPG